MDAASIPGRVVISSTAFERVFAAVAADALGVAASSASARVRDDRGSLHAEITSPVNVSPGGADVLSLADRARAEIARTGSRLTGANVSGSRIRITRITTSSRRIS